jgi:hypothetical protein
VRASIRSSVSSIKSESAFLSADYVVHVTIFDIDRVFQIVKVRLSPLIFDSVFDRFILSLRIPASRIKRSISASVLLKPPHFRSDGHLWFACFPFLSAGTRRIQCQLQRQLQSDESHEVQVESSPIEICLVRG